MLNNFDTLDKIKYINTINFMVSFDLVLKQLQENVKLHMAVCACAMSPWDSSVLEEQIINQ
jgi:hypothetical protein